MEIVMIKMQGCMPCKIFEPTVKQYAEEKRIKFRTLQMEDMPKELHPPYYPYFYLRQENDIIAEWGGSNERKMQSIIKRNLE
tara:strand:+ start:110 stop:355 length:246 start_codon:yes stop_codon:yes gene_type:complete